MIVSKVSYGTLRSGTSKLAKAGDMSTRVISAKRVDEEIVSLLASCAKIERRIKVTTCHKQLAKLRSLLERQQNIGQYLVAQHNAGRVYLNRA